MKWRVKKRVTVKDMEGKQKVTSVECVKESINMHHHGESRAYKVNPLRWRLILICLWGNYFT